MVSLFLDVGKSSSSLHVALMYTKLNCHSHRNWNVNATVLEPKHLCDPAPTLVAESQWGARRPTAKSTKFKLHFSLRKREKDLTFHEISSIKLVMGFPFARHSQKIDTNNR